MDEKRDLVVVAVRVRPPRTTDAQCCVSAGETPGAVITTDTSDERKGKQLAFGFARGFFWNAPETSSTRSVYEAVGRSLLEQALRGYNTSLLAYGQTGESFLLGNALHGTARPRVPT